MPSDKSGKELMGEIGRRLRTFRTRRGLTQEALARASKLTAKFVSQIENAHVNPSIAVLVRLIENGLAMSPAVFFAWQPGDGDLSAVVALLEVQPVAARKKIIRAIEQLCRE